MTMEFNNDYCYFSSKPVYYSIYHAINHYHKKNLIQHCIVIYCNIKKSRQCTSLSPLSPTPFYTAVPLRGAFKSWDLWIACR